MQEPLARVRQPDPRRALRPSLRGRQPAAAGRAAAVTGPPHAVRGRADGRPVIPDAQLGRVRLKPPLRACEGLGQHGQLRAPPRRAAPRRRRARRALREMAQLKRLAYARAARRARRAAGRQQRAERRAILGTALGGGDNQREPALPRRRRRLLVALARVGFGMYSTSLGSSSSAGCAASYAAADSRSSATEICSAWLGVGLGLELGVEGRLGNLQRNAL
eukprot:scaffold54667_cov53-Phaeocystis_antarctica.AAC.1